VKPIIRRRPVTAVKGEHNSRLQTQKLTIQTYMNTLQYHHNLYIAKKHIQWVTILLQTLWVYLYSFSRCCLQKSRIHAKFRQNLTL